MGIHQQNIECGCRSQDSSSVWKGWVISAKQSGERRQPGSGGVEPRQKLIMVNPSARPQNGLSAVGQLPSQAYSRFKIQLGRTVKTTGGYRAGRAKRRENYRLAQRIVGIGGSFPPQTEV